MQIAVFWHDFGWGAWFCHTEKLDPGRDPHPPPRSESSNHRRLAYRLGLAPGQQLKSCRHSRLAVIQAFTSYASVLVLLKRQAKALTLITYRLHDHEPASSQISTRLLGSSGELPHKDAPDTTAASREKGR
ncbi:hypothetical protein V8C26DRAFT_440535 [Trichoderma gracile]